MKKYIIPNTKSEIVIQGGILCHSQNGLGQQVDPVITPGTGKTAPARTVWI